MDQQQKAELITRIYQMVNEQKITVSNMFINAQVDALKKLHTLIKDVVTISVGILGIIVPLIIKSEIHLNVYMLIIGIIIFLICIVWGMSSLVYGSIVDIKIIPKMLRESLDYYNKEAQRLAEKINTNGYISEDDVAGSGKDSISGTQTKKLKYLWTWFYFSLFLFGILLFVVASLPIEYTIIKPITGSGSAI